MSDYWEQIEEQFARKNALKHLRLKDGATEEQLEKLERVIQVDLPESFKAFYRTHDGQTKGYGLIFGLQLLSTKGIVDSWKTWYALKDDGLNEEFAKRMSSRPEGYIKKLYLNLRWIPFTHDQSGNHLGIDFDPDVKGRVGQIIAFGRDENEKKLIANSFEEFLESYIKQLVELKWSLDKTGWTITHDTFGRKHYHDWILP
jgi:cell wall assembly regulator SMI1